MGTKGDMMGTYATEHWAKARYSSSTSSPLFSSLRNSWTQLGGTGGQWLRSPFILTILILNLLVLLLFLTILILLTLPSPPPSRATPCQRSPARVGHTEDTRWHCELAPLQGR